MGEEFSVVTLEVSHNYFLSKSNIEKFLTLGMEIIKVINPIYGKIHDVSDSVDIMEDSVYDVTKRIPAVFWGNYFGRYYVERIGKDKLLSFPEGIVKSLDDGDILIQR